MNYKINDSHTDPFYIGFFSVVDFPVSQQFQFDPCSIRKRKPVVIDGFYRIKFDLWFLPQNQRRWKCGHIRSLPLC